MTDVAAGYTGTVLGPVITDPKTGAGYRQVFSYENGECTDRYITKVRSA